MRIKLYFPIDSIQAIKNLGLNQRSPEILRWTVEHPASHYNIGVILRGKSGDILDGRNFKILYQNFGAWIEVDSARTKQRVENALVTVATGLCDQIKLDKNNYK